MKPPLMVPGMAAIPAAFPRIDVGTALSPVCMISSRTFADSLIRSASSDWAQHGRGGDRDERGHDASDEARWC